MSLQVEDFKEEGEALTVDKFKGEAPEGARLNNKTASQLAATGAILSESTIEEFRTIKEELLDPAKRQRFLFREEKIRRDIYEDAKSSVIKSIADPAVPHEDKVLIAAGAALDRADAVALANSTLKVLAEEALIADSGVNESEQSAESRNSMIGSIDKVVQSKRRAAAAIAELKLGQDQSLVDKAVDIGELMVPFAEWIHIDRLQKDVTGEAEIALMGQQKQMLFDEIKSLPVSERGLFIEKIIDLVQEHEDVVLNDGNDLLNLDILEKMLVDDDYSDFERLFDNAVSLLEVTGLAGVIRGLAKGSRGTKAGGKAQKGGMDGEVLGPEGDLVVVGERVAIEDAPIDAEYTDITDTLIESTARATHSDVGLASPSQIVKDTNPEQARNMHVIARDDDTGEAAEALYGTTREEAMAKDLLPEPEINEGEMPHKVEMSRPTFEEPEKIKKLRLANGNTAVSEAELGKVVQQVVDGMEASVGVIHKNSQVVRALDDGTFGVSMIFRPFDSGYATPTQALESSKFAFRNYGIPEEGFKLLERKGDVWSEVPVKDAQAAFELKQAGAKGEAFEGIDYAVALDFNYRFRPEDLTEVDLLQTGNAITKTLDAIDVKGPASFGQGSVSQHLFDASSIIHPQIVNAASVSVDRAVGLKKLYIEEFQEFTDFWAKTSKERRALMTDYINKANFEGIPFDKKDLYNRGFEIEEVKALEKWRRGNDAMWHATNDDMAKTLRARGVKVLTHPDSGTSLFGYPMSRNAASSRRVKAVYDVSTDSVVPLSAKEIEELYESGGELMKVTSPIDIDGQWVEIAVSRNTSYGGYTRAIYDGEVVLPYRDGYYPVMYDANFFVEMKVKMSDGSIGVKTVASARNSKEAKEAVEMLTKTNPKAEFSYRKDKRLEAARENSFDEGSWSLAQSSGLTAQRVRGERLRDAGVDLHKAGNTNLVDPLEAIANQINQVSQRVAMRTYLETAKRRWILNYGKYLDLTEDAITGETGFPRSVTAIKGKTGVPSKMVADARTNFNYIYSLENGYINGIDEMYKAVANYAASALGELGFSKFEEVMFDFAKMSPTQRAKTLAFRLFISGNPARQSLIQRGQMLMIGGINPTAAPQIVADLVAIDAVRSGALKGSKRVQDLYEEIKDVGILQAVDAHNLLREDTLRLADMTASQKAMAPGRKALNTLQRIGFDWAEQDVLLSSYLAHRDLAVKAGKNIKSQRVRDEILGQARAFTLTMNRAGEMPYSHNTLGLIGQFFSFRHKALLQGVTNKSLTKMQRAQVLAYTAAMFGPEATVLTFATNSLWGDTPPSETKDRINDGLLDYTLNQALTMATGEDQAIDFGDFAPSEAYGIGNVFVGMMTTDLGEMLANAPAGSLLFGSNPRVTQAFKTGARYFNIIDDYEDPELETSLADVGSAALNLYSGYSNAFKANYAYRMRQKMSSTGRITDEDVTAAEAMAAAFGFRTKDEVGRQDMYNLLYGDSSFTDDDVKTWVRDLKIHLARRGTTLTEDDMAQRVLSEAWRVFSQDRPRAWETISKEIERDAQNGDYTLMMGIISKMGFRTEEENWKLINALPKGPVRDRLTDVMQFGKETEDGR